MSHKFWPVVPTLAKALLKLALSLVTDVCKFKLSPPQQIFKSDFFVNTVVSRPDLKHAKVSFSSHLKTVNQVSLLKVDEALVTLQQR